MKGYEKLLKRTKWPLKRNGIRKQTFQSRYSSIQLSSVSIIRDFFVNLHRKSYQDMKRSKQQDLLMFLGMWLVATFMFFAILFIMEYDSLAHMIHDFGWDDVVLELMTVLVFIVISFFYNKLFFHLAIGHREYRLLTIAHAVILLVLNIFASFLLMKIYNLYWPMPNDDFVKGVYIFSLISTFVASIDANVELQKMIYRQVEEKHALEIENARQKEIGMQARLMVLKSQVDPHFLFNNFSILSDLIDEDPKVAGSFLDNLSKVYRYKLTEMEHNLVDVNKELQMIKAYAALITTRFGRAIQIHITEPASIPKGMVPPLAIQMLVENAVKHNAHTTADPLNIDITITEQQITVSNRIHPLSSTVSSTGIGLKNLADRYGLLSVQKIEIEENNNNFIVKLPILTR